MKLEAFKSNWLGRKFKCPETGEVVKLTADMIHPRAFIPVGKGAIDLGDGFYSRTVGGVFEVFDEFP